MARMKSNSETNGQYVTPNESKYSRFLEQMTEHVFIAEILQEAWYGFEKTIEVLRSEVDAYGYDLAIECNGILRHVQLKAGQSARYVTVHLSLAEKPRACVIWIRRKLDRTSGRTTLSYLYYGGHSKQRMPSVEHFPKGRHTRGDKKERPDTRVLKKTDFTPIADTTDLLRVLFGLRKKRTRGH
jgi:hypothetical protein